MPEQEHFKIKPEVAPLSTPEERRARARGVEYAELQVTSNFSFLRGGSHPEELVAAAAESGCASLAITDWHTLAGIVRGHAAAEEMTMGFLVGARVMAATAWNLDAGEAAGEPLVHEQPKDRPMSTASLELLLYPTTRAAYGRLCRMLTVGKQRTEKGQCQLVLEDVLAAAEDMLAIIVPPEPVLAGEDFFAAVRQVKEAFNGGDGGADDRLSLAARCAYDGQDAPRLAQLAQMSRTLAIPLVATNDVHYHAPERRPLQDVLTCIRLGCTVHEAGFALFANAERHIKGPAEMARLFRDYPQAIARTMEIARRASAFSLNDLKYEYPDEICPPGKSLMEHLRDRTWEGARERYRKNDEIRMTPPPNDESNPNDKMTNVLKRANEACLEHSNIDHSSIDSSFEFRHSSLDAIPASVRERLEHELRLIEELNYPAYFLTVDDIVRFARSQGILCQGRGAAANSAVCYCLGVTAVDPARIDLLVERFISKERNEPPDIDIDFEHERREEVIQYIYNKYGRDRAALVAEVITYRRRSAIREVGKALGLSLDCVDRLAKSGDWWDNDIIAHQRLRELGFDPADLTLRRAIKLAGELRGFPRHLSQHVGGFVISRGPLCEIVPIENAAMPDRTVIEWDKDDIDEMGMLKVDCLGLGMLTCIRKSLDFVNSYDDSRKKEALQFHTVPPDDSAVYDMLCKADSIGVFQVESRAQMTMLPRLKPRCYYDLVIEVAIVRPGPIQGGMVHPYLRRRNGEKPDYPDDKVRAVLERTLGVPLFQEQAMRLVMVAAGFTAGEADQLRRAMAAWKRKGHLIERFTGKILTGMAANGYTQAFALRVVDQIKGFADYGFPESHAASFALLVYVSAWLKCHHPAAFAAALINSQPMGFYQPAQIVRDAKEHGVTILPVDVNASGWDCRLEYSDEATERRSDEGEGKGFKNSCARVGHDLTVSFKENVRGKDQNVSGFDCLATGNGIGTDHLRNHSTNARIGAVRPDQSNPPGSSLNPFEHCGRPCTSNPTGLPQASSNRQRIASGINDPIRIGMRAQHDQIKSEGLLLASGRGSNSPRPDSQPGSENQDGTSKTPGQPSHKKLAPSPSPSSLRRSVASSLRLGMRLITHMRQPEADAIAHAVQKHGPFSSIEALWRASGVRVAALRALAQADAFGSMGLDRQHALWEVMKLRDVAMPLFDGGSDEATKRRSDEDKGRNDLEDAAAVISSPSSLRRSVASSLLPPIPPSTQVVYDYAATGLSLKAHPISFARSALAQAGIAEAGDIADEKLFPHGKKTAVAGLVLVRQRPGTAAGIVFVTLEDETGVTNLVVRPTIYEEYRKALRHSVALVAWGKVERQGQVVHVLVERAANLTDVVARRDQKAPRLQSASRDFH